MAERDIIARIVVEGGQQAATQLDNVAKSEREIVAATKEANTALNTQNQQLSENTAATKGAVGAQESLKKQLRELKAELARLAVEGRKNTEEYRRLRQEAGQLDDAIKDVNAEIAQAGSDTRGIDNVIRVAGVAAAGFGVLEGATALFGDQNEELQKTLTKVTGAMTLLTSLQSISNELTKGDTVFKVAAAKANTLYQAAISGATGATKAFRIALIATGIGAIVISIGLLVANWDKLSRAITRSFPRLADFGAAVQRVIQRVTDLLGITSKEERAQSATVKTLEAKNKQLEREAAYEESRGDRVAAAQRQLQIAQNELRILQAQGAAQDDILDAQNNIKIAQQEVTNAKNDAAKASEKNAKALKDETKEINEQLKGLDLYEKKIRDLQDKIRQLNPETDAQLILLLFGEKAALDKKVQEYSDAFKKLEREAKGMAFEPVEILKPVDDKEFANQLQNTLDLTFDLSKNITKAILDNDKNRTKNINANAKLEFENTAKLLENNGFLRAKAIREEIERRKKAGEQIGDLEKQLQAANFQGAQDSANQALAFFTKIQNARLAILQNQLDKGLISEEEYNQKVAQINRQQAIADKAKALFDIAINTASAIVSALTIPPPFGQILAGIVGGLAGIQAAVVASTPIPKFRYGGQVLGGGSVSPEGMLSGRSHAGGGMLIEAEGGEFITRKEMTKKYLPILKAINQDKLDDVLYPKIPIMRTFGSVASQSQRKADKRMEMLIEEVQFMSQYIRQGNKYARVTAETNTQLTKQKQSKHYV